MSIVLDRLQKARALPPGHYGLKAAESAVQKEYEASHTQECLWEKRFLRKMKKMNLDLEEARLLLEGVCSQLGERKKAPKLVLNSRDLHPEAGAHCDYARKELHFRRGGENKNCIP